MHHHQSNNVMNYDANPIHTLYDNETLKHLVEVVIERVSRILWELIWEHKVFLLFGRSPLLGLSNGEDRFVKY